MQVWVDVKCIQATFGGRGLSSFGDLVLFNFLALLILLSLYRTILESCCSMTDHWSCYTNWRHQMQSVHTSPSKPYSSLFLSLSLSLRVLSEPYGTRNWTRYSSVPVRVMLKCCTVTSTVIEDPRWVSPRGREDEWRLWLHLAWES